MLTVGEVAQMLRVYPTTVRRWEKQGLLKSRRLGPKRSVRFMNEDVTAFVNSAGADAAI